MPLLRVAGTGAWASVGGAPADHARAKATASTADVRQRAHVGVLRSAAIAAADARPQVCGGAKPGVAAPVAGDSMLRVLNSWDVRYAPLLHCDGARAAVARWPSTSAAAYRGALPLLQRNTEALAAPPRGPGPEGVHERELTHHSAALQGECAPSVQQRRGSCSPLCVRQACSKGGDRVHRFLCFDA